MTDNLGEKTELTNWLNVDRGERDDRDFTWGYGGHGPGDLGYSILRELFGKKIASKYLEEFVEEFVSQWPQHKPWRVSDATLKEWVRARNREDPDFRRNKNLVQHAVFKWLEAKYDKFAPGSLKFRGIMTDFNWFDVEVSFITDLDESEDSGRYNEVKMTFRVNKEGKIIGYALKEKKRRTVTFETSAE